MWSSPEHNKKEKRRDDAQTHHSSRGDFKKDVSILSIRMNSMTVEFLLRKEREEIAAKTLTSP
jgi:hypothetical protein